VFFLDPSRGFCADVVEALQLPCCADRDQGKWILKSLQVKGFQYGSSKFCPSYLTLEMLDVWFDWGLVLSPHVVATGMIQCIRFQKQCGLWVSVSV